MLFALLGGLNLTLSQKVYKFIPKLYTFTFLGLVCVTIQCVYHYKANKFLFDFEGGWVDKKLPANLIIAYVWTPPPPLTPSKVCNFTYIVAHIFNLIIHKLYKTCNTILLHPGLDLYNMTDCLLNLTTSSDTIFIENARWLC